MAKVIIYSTDYCPFCTRAKNLLEDKGVPYEEINVQNDPVMKKKIMDQTGMRTVPQIFINDEFIGGFQELSALINSKFNSRHVHIQWNTLTFDIALYGIEDHLVQVPGIQSFKMSDQVPGYHGIA